MSKDIDFTPGVRVPSTYLNQDQEGDTGLIWGLFLGQSTANTLTLKVPTIGDAQGAAVVGGKKRWNTANESSGTVGGVAGTRNIYLTAGTITTGLDLEVSSSVPTADLSRRIGTAYWDGSSNLRLVKLQHGVQAEADQFNSFTFRSIATGTGETPVTIAGWSAQANNNTRLLSIGADSPSYVERMYVTGTGLMGFEAAGATDIAFRSRTTADTNGQYRFQRDASGKMTFADSAGANSATFERTASGTLKITSTLDVASILNSGGDLLLNDNVNIQGSLSLSGVPLQASHLSDSATLARLASPGLTGVPTAPTAAADTSTTQIATTAFVVGQGYLKSATAVSTYAALASPGLTGVPTAPTAAADTNTTQIATTAFVVGQGYAKLAGPTFTGTPTLPTGTVGVTQTAGDSSTKLATTAFATTADNLKANLAGGNTFAGAQTFSGAITANAAVGINAALTVTTGGFSSVFGGSDLTLTNTNQTAYLSSSGLAFGPSGGSGSVDWALTRQGANYVELGSSDKIRDTSDPVHANDLSRKSFVDTRATVVIPHTFAIGGPLAVASGDTDYIPPMFIPVPAGRKATITGMRARINSGTSAAVGLRRNGSSFAGGNATVTTTATTTDFIDVPCSDNDMLALVITSVSGSPKNLSVTVYVEYGPA